MKSTLGTRTCLKCGEDLSGPGPDHQILVGEVDVVDPITRHPVRHHYKFHRKCFESFKDHAERRTFMQRATELGLTRRAF